MGRHLRFYRSDAAPAIAALSVTHPERRRTDVLLVPDGVPRMPVECYRVDTSERRGQFNIELEKGIAAISKSRRLALAVNVRAHSDPDRADVAAVLEAVQVTLKPRPAERRWVTTGVLQGRYQVSVRVAAYGRFTRESIDTSFFDMAVEPTLTMEAEARGVAGGKIAFASAWCVGVRHDWRTVRRQFEQILDGFRIKKEQLQKSCGQPSSSGRFGGAGVVALRTPMLSASDLFALDEDLRGRLSEPGCSHVAGVMLWWDEPERTDGSGAGSKGARAGRRARIYHIVNPNARPRLPGDLDSRRAVFGSGQQSYSVIDPVSGRLAATVGTPDTGVPQPQHWPPGAFEEVGALSAAEGSLDVTLGLNEQFWHAQGDALLAYTRFGRNELRFIRDQHLNLRVLRVGDGAIRARPHN